MAYITVTSWDCTEWTDAMEAMARDTFLPMILEAGAKNVEMVRTGDLSFSVITRYGNEKQAHAAQAGIAKIREKAAVDLPMKMTSVVSGTVFVKGKANVAA